MTVYALRVWLPDLPGALGRVASRIGVAGGDVLAIEVLDRSAMRALDEFILTLESEAMLDVLTREIGSVEGVELEDIRRIDDEGRVPSISVLESLAEVVTSDDDVEVLRGMLAAAAERSRAEWGAIVDSDGAVEYSFGEAPDAETLASIERSDEVASWFASRAGAYVFVAPVPAVGLYLILGRTRSSFRPKEHGRVAAVVAICNRRLL